MNQRLSKSGRAATPMAASDAGFSGVRAQPQGQATFHAGAEKCSVRARMKALFKYGATGVYHRLTMLLDAR